MGTRPIFDADLQPEDRTLRQQVNKVLDHLRSELESLEFSNAALELTMAALQTIQDRHPLGPIVEQGVPLTRKEIAEYMMLKRENISPSNSIFASEIHSAASGDHDDRTGSEGESVEGNLYMESEGVHGTNDVEMGPEAPNAMGGLDMESEGDDEANNVEMGSEAEQEFEGTDEDETRSVDSGMTDISSTGLNAAQPSDRNNDDLDEESLGTQDSEDSDGTTISSQGFSLASTPAMLSAVQTPMQAGVSTAYFRGPVKFPSRLRPMPYAPDSLETPTSTSKTTKSRSSSPIIATSPVPQVPKLSRIVKASRKWTGPSRKSTLPSGPSTIIRREDVIDLTARIRPAEGQEVIELESSPLSSVPATLPSSAPWVP